MYRRRSPITSRIRCNRVSSARPSRSHPGAPGRAIPATRQFLRATPPQMAAGLAGSKSVARTGDGCPAQAVVQDQSTVCRDQGPCPAPPLPGSVEGGKKLPAAGRALARCKDALADALAARSCG